MWLIERHVQTSKFQITQQNVYVCVYVYIIERKKWCAVKTIKTRMDMMPSKSVPA